jgi:hypothetical protein
LFVMFGQLIHCFCLLSSEQYGNATRYWNLHWLISALFPLIELEQ